MSLSDAEQDEKLVWLTEEYYQAYRQAVNQASFISKQGSELETVIAYTAMHGVGAQMAEDLLHDNGFHKVFSVAEQREPDGHFPTVNFPNPEEKGAMDLLFNWQRVSMQISLVLTTRMQTGLRLQSNFQKAAIRC